MTTPEDFQQGPFEASTEMIGTPGIDARFVVEAAAHRRALEEHRKILALAVAASGGEIRIPRRLVVELAHLFLSEEWTTDEWVLRYKPAHVSENSESDGESNPTESTPNRAHNE